jgi:hypothetical protein
MCHARAACIEASFKHGSPAPQAAWACKHLTPACINDAHGRIRSVCWNMNLLLVMFPSPSLSPHAIGTSCQRSRWPAQWRAPLTW